MSLSVTPDLAGHISEVEMMHEVSEGEINAIIQITTLYTQSNKLESTELSDVDTDLIKNNQYNGAMPPLGTQPYSPHSPLTNTLVSLDETLPQLRFDSGDAAVLARKGDFPGVHLQGVDNMLFGLYQYLVQQNTGNHMDGIIT